MNRTKIEYLDYTLNIMPGCSGRDCAVSGVCWAKGQLKRKKPYVDKKGIQRGCQQCYDFVPHTHWSRSVEPFEVKKPSRIGLNFTGDTFEKFWLTPEGKNCQRSTLEMCKRAYWHIFIILTKQPQNIPLDLEFPKNVWLGVSVNRKADLWRISELLKRNVKFKFVSFEPLYENLGAVDLSGIDWVIVGGQTRPKKLPQYSWVRSLIRLTKVLDIPVFVKNNIDELFLFPTKKPQEIPEVKEK